MRESHEYNISTQPSRQDQQCSDLHISWEVLGIHHSVQNTMMFLVNYHLAEETPPFHTQETERASLITYNGALDVRCSNNVPKFK